MSEIKVYLHEVYTVEKFGEYHVRVLASWSYEGRSKASSIVFLLEEWEEIKKRGYYWG